MATHRTSDEPWYWDLERGVAVPASERGLASNMLGPYPSRAEAERWQEKVDERNEAWDEADEEWNEGDTDRDDDADGNEERTETED